MIRQKTPKPIRIDARSNKAGSGLCIGGPPWAERLAQATGACQLKRQARRRARDARSGVTSASFQRVLTAEGCNCWGVSGAGHEVGGDAGDGLCPAVKG